MSEMGSRTHAPHQRQEMAFRMRAQLALGDDPRYFWLCDRSVIEAGKPKSWRPQLLAGLGRLLEERGREQMLALADQLCQQQPTTREALALIRARRLEGGPNRSLAFCAAVLEAAERFLSKAPPLSPEELTAAMDEVLAALLADQEPES